MAAVRSSGFAEGVKAEKDHSQSSSAASAVRAQQATIPSPDTTPRRQIGVVP